MPNWRDELRAISRRDPTTGDEAAAIGDALHTTESDRGCALIAGQLAENGLQQIIRLHASQLPNNKLEEVFGFEAPMGIFSAKIKVAHALGIIDAEIRGDLDRIREIRNAFAHSLVVISFKTPQVIRGCDGFHAPMPPGMKDLLKGQETARQNYVNAAVSITHVAGLAMTAFGRGHKKKALRTLTYDEARTSRDKLWRQLQKRIPKNRGPAGTLRDT